jgi:hypothetical protein
MQYASLLCFLLAPSWGQETSPPQTPAAASPTQPQGTANRTKANQTGNQQNQAKGTSKDRLFFLLPNSLTLESAVNVPPLTAGQKIKTTLRDTLDPVQFAWYGAQAGLSQARDTDASYGQGAEGFGKRYGVRFADGTIENVFTRAIFPALLRQDPRYYQLGKGGFWHRAGYAVSRIFVTRSDSGSTQFNYSEILGSATAAGISAFTYHPSSSRNLDSFLQIWGTQVGWDAVSNGLKEFWPDIRRRLHPSKSTPATTGGSH